VTLRAREGIQKAQPECNAAIWLCDKNMVQQEYGLTLR
jgi:hypothetical protein